MHTIRIVLTNSIGGYNSEYCLFDFVSIRRTSVEKGLSLLGYELLMSKQYPVTLSPFDFPWNRHKNSST